MFTRVQVDPEVMQGAPCIRGTRIPVAMIVRMIADGTPVEELLADYPQVSAEDVREALRFAAASVDQHVLPLHQTV
jgi:uncharacterized protein (DUF433 family)